MIHLAPSGDGWSSGPLSDDLAEVSNNGFGYTGEIDLFELVVPAAGRLVFSLDWTQAANLDLIVASDDRGKVRLAVGAEDGNEPEYVSLDVVADQTLFVFVAGWAGEPGEYVLETILLPPGAPTFAVDSGPHLAGPWPANLPLEFSFNVELDTAQDIGDRAYVVSSGHVVEGTWCIEGSALVFYPALREEPGSPPGLVPGARHTLQFPRAARGPRATTGEHLADVYSVSFDVGAPVDLLPLTPPRISATNPDPRQPYDGSLITVALTEALDADTVAPELLSVATDGSFAPLPFEFTLTQQYRCGGGLEVRLLVSPLVPPAPGTRTRLRLPGSIRGISGEAGAGNALNGGAGADIDFRSR